MSPGAEHEDFAGMADARGARARGRAWASLQEHGIDPLGAAGGARAIEADATLLSRRREDRRRPAAAQKTADWPLPDLAIEIDMSRSQVDRPGIYAALGVPEVWRFDGETVRIDRLGPDGTYAEAPESGWLGVRPDEVVRPSVDRRRGRQRLLESGLAWAREVLVPGGDRHEHDDRRNAEIAACRRSRSATRWSSWPRRRSGSRRRRDPVLWANLRAIPFASALRLVGLVGRSSRRRDGTWPRRP